MFIIADIRWRWRFRYCFCNVINANDIAWYENDGAANPSLTQILLLVGDGVNGY